MQCAWQLLLVPIKRKKQKGSSPESVPLMPARKCVGRIQEDGSVEACCFNGRSVGQPANALTEDSRCAWCSPAEMHRRIGNGRLEKLLVYSLLNFNEDIRAVALRRLPPRSTAHTRGSAGAAGRGDSRMGRQMVERQCLRRWKQAAQQMHLLRRRTTMRRIQMSTRMLSRTQTRCH